MNTPRNLTATAALAAFALAACGPDSATAPRVGPSAGPARTISQPAQLPGGPCPNTGGDWTKIDHNSGYASGAWGSLSYPKGQTVTVNVNAGYQLELCIKSGEKVGTVGYTITGPEVNGQITIAQDISHTSFKVTRPPVVKLQNLEVSKGATASYDRSVHWGLKKTVNGVEQVTFAGMLGQSFPAANWEVVADKTESKGNYSVVGQITVTNPNPVPVNVSVTDVLYAGANALGTAVEVDCDAVAAGGQSTGTVPANGTLVCDYEAAPSAADATQNKGTAAVTAYDPPANAEGEIQGGNALAPVSWTENVIGDDQVTLGDLRFSYSELISADKSKLFPETFSCPTDASLYQHGYYTTTVVNTATVKGDHTELSDDASVVVKCSAWKGETATGFGTPWRTVKGAPNNWFMFTPWSALASGHKVDLIAGQNYDAGDITAARSGTTTLTIALHAGFRLAAASNNVKILPMQSCTPGSYVQPGQYTVKRTADQAQSTITVTGLPNANCYAIHLDVERLLAP